MHFGRRLKGVLVKSFKILLWHMFCIVHFCFSELCQRFCQSLGAVPRNNKGRLQYRIGLPRRNQSLPRTWHLSNCMTAKICSAAGLVHWLYECEWYWRDTGQDIFIQRASESSGERCSSYKDHSVNQIALWSHRFPSAQYFHLHSAEDFRGFCESFIGIELI